MDLIGKIDKGPLLPVHQSACYLLIKETSLYFVHLVEIYSLMNPKMFNMQTDIVMFELK